MVPICLATSVISLILSFQIACIASPVVTTDRNDLFKDAGSSSSGFVDQTENFNEEETTKINIEETSLETHANVSEHTTNNGDELVIKYYCEPEAASCPTQKHYFMYPIGPDQDFYPCWTYHGFHPPSDWHNVAIKYFEKPPPILNTSENYDIRKHGSVMHLCTERITEDINECKNKMENECANSMPSPIDILTEEAVEDPKLSDLRFISYNEYFGFDMYFEPDGTQLLFIKFLPHYGLNWKMPGIQKGPLGSENPLFLDRILVRVGFDPEQGSEHSLDGKFFGMELQFFFTADALSYWETLSQYKLLPPNDGSIGHQMHVVSIFVQVTAAGKEPPHGSAYAGNFMETLSLAAQKFWASENENFLSTVRVEKKVLSLEDFFSEPSNGIYYTYEGSLSHPPCLTHVGWTIFEKPIWIKYHQWRRFAYVHAEYSDNRFLAGNIRPQNQILVKVDIDTYIQMKRVEGQGELTQNELDEAAENTRQPLVEFSDENPPLPIPLHLIRNYEDYKQYFGKRVRKSKNVHRHLGVGRDLNDYDYEDGGKGRRKSGQMGIHFRTIMLILPALWMTIIGSKPDFTE